MEVSRLGPGLQPVRESPPGAGRGGMRLPVRLGPLRSTPLAARPPGRGRARARAGGRRAFSRGRPGGTMAEEAKRLAACAAVDKHVQVRHPGLLIPCLPCFARVRSQVSRLITFPLPTAARWAGERARAKAPVPKLGVL